MAVTDLDNLSNMLIIADCNNSHDFPSDFVNVQSVTNKLGIDCHVYKCGNDRVVTFSPFDYKSLMSFVSTGASLLYKQDMVSLDGGVCMNRFFHDNAKEFYDMVRPALKCRGKIYITGVSMGGSIGLCFSYFVRELKKKSTVRVHTFGSPRVGNLALRNWFDRNVTVDNYTLVRVVNGVKRVDPVCLFPSTTYGCYVNNNLQAIFNKEIMKDASVYMDQPDTHITLTSVAWNARNGGLDKDTAQLWDEIHDIGRYFEDLPVS